MKSLRKYVRLSHLERSLLAWAAVLLPVVRFSVATAGFRLTERWLGVMFPVPPGAQRAPQNAPQNEALCDMAARMVRAAAGHGLVGAACLPQSLVLWSLLRRRGLDATVRFGVRRNAGVVEAHAWVEAGEGVWDPAGQTSAGFAPLMESSS